MTDGHKDSATPSVFEKLYWLTSSSWRIFWVSAAVTILLSVVWLGIIEYFGLNEESTLAVILILPTFIALLISLISFTSFILFGLGSYIALFLDFLYEILVRNPLKTHRANKEARKEGYRNHAEKEEEELEKYRLKYEKIQEKFRIEREAEVRAMIPKIRPTLRKMANDVFEDVKNFSLDAIEESLKFTHTYDGVKLNVNYSDVFDRTYKEIKEEMIHDRDVNSGWIARRKKRSLGAGKRSRKTTCMRCGVGVSSSSSQRYYKGVKVCSNCNRGMQDEW